MAKPLLSFKPTEFHKISDFGRDEVRKRYPDRISFDASTGEGAFPNLHPAVHKSGRTIPLDITFTLDEPRDLLLTVDLKTTRGLLEEFWHRLAVNGRFAFENKIPTVCFQSMQPAGGAAPYSYSALIDADFLRQGANTLTFTCESVAAGMPYEWTVYREITLQTTEEELEILGAEATVFFARAGDGLMQRVDVEFLSTVPHDELVPFGDLREVSIEVAGYCTKEDVTIHRGVSTRSFLVPEVKAETELTVTVDGHPARKFLIHPKRKWKVHFIHHSHLDIGYSDTIAAVTKGQARNLAKAIEYADMTQDWPPDSRFHWTVESSWIVEQYLSAGGDVERLREAIRRGQIEIAASYAGVYYDNCIDEMLLRQFYKVRKFEELLGAAAGACMVTDIPGWPRGLAEALVDVGVPYLDASPHYLYAAPPDDFERPCIFYLKAHDTEKRALTWYSIYHYQQGNAGLKLFKGRSALEPHLANRLEHIARAGYSYDAYQVRIQGEFADNSKPNLTTSKTIRQWNERWAYPKLIFSTNQEFFGYMEREYGDEIPTVAGDISDWWVRGVLCYPIQTALDRNTQRKLVEAETLASMARLWNPAFEYPAEKIASAYQDTIIWKEHTHGYFAGQGEKNEEIWAGKKRCVEAAGRACDEATSDSVEALKAAFAGPEPGVLVVNTRSWPVEGYVEVAAAAVPEGCELKDPESAAPVSCCRLEDGSKIRFWAKVPALAAKVYQIVEGDSAGASSDLKVGEAELENRYYRISLDPATGAVASIFDKILGVEMVDGDCDRSLGEHVIRRPEPLAGRKGRLKGIASESDGQTACVTVENEIEEIGTIQQKISLRAGVRRIDIENTLDAKAILPGADTYFAFPFKVANPAIVFDAPYGPTRFLEDLLPGSALDHQAAQNWIDVSNPDFGVTLCCLDAPLVEFCEIRTEQYKSKQGLFDRADESEKVANGHVYSCVMRRPRTRDHTSDTGDGVSFRYSITTHKGPLDRLAADRFGWEAFCPLKGVFVSAAEGDGTARPVSTFLELATDSVVVYVAKKGEKEDSLVLRLREIAGKEAAATVKLPFTAAKVYGCTGHEKNVDLIAEETDSIALAFRPNEVKTIKIEPAAR